MLKSDSTLLIQIQLALIGIVVVIGLFYLWRIITRLEERVNKSLCKCSKKVNTYEDNSNTMQFPSIISQLQNDMNDLNNEHSFEEMKNAEELMKQVFGGNDMNMHQPTMVMFSMESMPENPPSNVVVEELSNNETEDVNKESLQEQELNEQADSETNDDSISLDVNPMSKSKLALMKVEKLRALCKARDLSTEGLKPQLIERLLGLTRE